jgi:hypothetical protein
MRRALVIVSSAIALGLAGAIPAIACPDHGLAGAIPVSADSPAGQLGTCQALGPLVPQLVSTTDQNLGDQTTGFCIPQQDMSSEATA